FQPKSISKELLAELPERSRRVLVDRFGLSGKGEERTLDAIGKEYNITRERVRQIENHGIVVVRESETYEGHSDSFDQLKKAVEGLGAGVGEEILLENFSKNAPHRTHIFFLLTVGHNFDNRREDNAFRARWFSDKELADSIEKALNSLYESIEQSRLTP